MVQDSIANDYFNLLDQEGRSLFEDAHAVFMPRPFTDQVLGNVIATTNSTFLVLFNVEFVISLVYTYGISTDNIMFYSDHPNKTTFAEDIGVKVLTNLDRVPMKIDVVVANPPFSVANEGKTAGKKAVNLYPKFYEKSLEIADVVCMIMPETSNQVNAAHNERIKATAYDIRPITSEQFPGVGIKMWTVFAHKSIPANVDDHFTDFQVANNLAFQKGKLNLSTVKDSVQAMGVRVIKAVYKNEGVIEEFIDPKAVRLHHCLPSSGYAVLMPLTMTDDGWRVEIEPCEGQAVNVNVYYILADSLEEAERLRDLVTSEQFVEQAKNKRGNQNVITVTALRSISI